MDNAIFQIKHVGNNQTIDYRKGHKYLIVWLIGVEYVTDKNLREKLRLELEESYIFLGMRAEDFKIVFVAGLFEPVATIEIVQ